MLIPSSFKIIMIIKSNNLRFFRRKTGLQLGDMSFLQEQLDSAYLCRVERGTKQVTTESLLFYVAVTRIDPKILLSDQYREVQYKLLDRIDLLIPMIEDLPPSKKRNQRLQTLKKLQEYLKKETQ